MDVNNWTQTSSQIDIHFQTLVATETVHGWDMAHTDRILFSPFLQSSGDAVFFSLARRACRAIRAQLRFLKGKFHRLSGAIDFHLTEQKSVLASIKHRLTSFQPISCAASSKSASLLLITRSGQHSDLI